MFVVAGATGHTGSVVASTLLARGQKVRALVHDRTKPAAAALAARGAEIAEVSIEDTERLAAALGGAAGAYVLLPPALQSDDLVARNRRLVDSWAAALTRAGVGHTVLLSSIAAHLPGETGPVVTVRDAEQRLPGPLTAVRAAYFIDNIAGMVGLARDQGILPALFDPTRRIAMVSPRDIGRVAAEALLAGPAGRRIIELAGPTDASPDDLSAALGRALGREVRSVRVPDEAIVPTLTQAGMSANVAGLYREMVHAIDAGRFGFEGVVPLTRGTVGVDEAVAGLL